MKFVQTGKLPPDDQAEKRTERAAIMENDGGLARDEAEAKACLSYPCLCRGLKFWVSIHGPIICGSCHPPAMQSLVIRWIEIKPSEAINQESNHATQQSIFGGESDPGSAT